MSSKESGNHPVATFLLVSMLIGFVISLPLAFFPPTRPLVRFLIHMEAVKIAGDLVQFAIVCTLLGLIVQGAFHLMRRALSSLRSSTSQKG